MGHTECLGPRNDSLCDPAGWLHAILHAPRPTEGTTPRGTSDAHRGLWVTPPHQCGRLIRCKRRPYRLVGGAGPRGVCQQNGSLSSLFPAHLISHVHSVVLPQAPDTAESEVTAKGPCWTARGAPNPAETFLHQNQTHFSTRQALTMAPLPSPVLTRPRGPMAPI